MADVIPYTRSATQNDDSLAQQLADCRRWAQANGHHLVASFSAVISGRANDPPGWNEAVALAIDTGAAIVVRDATRVSRDFQKFEARLDILKKYGIDLFVIADLP